MVVSAIVVGGGTGCEKSSKQEGASTNAPSAASAPLAQTAAAPSASTGTGASSSSTEVCPYPKRCTEGCKKAFWQGMMDCDKEGKAIQNSPNADKLGKCGAACITTHDQCVSAATPAECRCRAECNKDMSADDKAKFEPFAKCLEKFVAAGCY